MAWRNILLALMIGFLARTGAAQAPPPREMDAIISPQLRDSAFPGANPKNPLGGPSQVTTNPAQLQRLTEISPGCAVPKVSAQVNIHNDLAETLLTFQCVNTGGKATQAPIAVPLPNGARLSENLPKTSESGHVSPVTECTVLPAGQASVVWQNLAKQLSCSAPVEFCGLPLLQTNPVPLPAQGQTPISLNYAFTCPSSGSRFDYVLPRSESVEYAVPWSMQVHVQADKPISTVYSPSHKLETKRLSANSFQVKVAENEAAQPGGFWLSYLLEQGELSATLFTQPDGPENSSTAEGTFLFLLGGPADSSRIKGIPRELTLALDRSSSMQGEKMEQVREAATQIIQGLNEDESFNVIAYNNKVASFADKPVRKTAENFKAACKFIQAMQPRGGTDLQAALLEAVRQEPTPRTLPIVLCLTDGLPTVGETAEAKIRDGIAARNSYHQRIFTVGVGVDVNTPLLETLADETRALPTFVLPKENIKTKVSQVFQSLARPILADADLEIRDADGQTETTRVCDVYPNPLPDLFQEDHLVVLGRYHGTDPLTFRVQGNYLGEKKTFAFTFPLKDQPAYPFVSRLWATQKIAALVQEIRKSGATADPYEILANPKQDPKLKSLAEEVLKLTTRYGILTEYTAFLAKDTGPWLNPSQQLNRAYSNFDERAVKTRVGLSSVSQSINNSLLQRQYSLNGTNSYWDADMRRVGVSNVQQLGSGAYFLRGSTWVDGRLLNLPNLRPAKTITFGSPAYTTLLNRLVKTGAHTPLSLSGNVLMQIDDKPVLIRGLEKQAASIKSK